MKPLLRYFSCVLRVIVLLEGKPSAQSEVLSTLETVFVQDIPVRGHCDGNFLMGINQNRETYIQKCALYVFSLIVRKAFFM